MYLTKGGMSRDWVAHSGISPMPPEGYYGYCNEGIEQISTGI
jgi:hypothetical protein